MNVEKVQNGPTKEWDENGRRHNHWEKKHSEKKKWKCKLHCKIDT